MDLVATHQRSLIAATMRTSGPILELGCGWYSTPLLHEIAKVQQRKLYTYDNNADWLNEYMKLNCEWHKLELIGWWGDMPLEEARYGLCFIDSAQPAEREYSVRKLLNYVDVFVLHDTEELPAYGYNRVLPMFKHKWTDKAQKTWTTIASNYVDVTAWGMTQLPPCEPVTEVT